MRPVCLVSLMLTLACSEPPASASEPASSGAEATPETTAREPVASETPANQPASPECGAYLAHYRRCEPVIASEIAAGDRRPVHAEESWIRYMEGTAEAPTLPSFCREEEATLSAICP
jgi:hypothetical protein